MKLNEIASVKPSGSLPCLLGTDEGDYPAQFCALGSTLLDDTLVDSLGLGQVRGAPEHTLLQSQHLLQSVVEERCTESNAVRSAAVESHLKFARFLLLGSTGLL